ncbi:hypothetical protein M433DRAFT_171148 [Acidomyces richmondensis BFW]|nr:MAG: hypothetical protein FE78DRAFT_100457 [Acidomyces sp. 'richmondensis']KYG49707.1 hypothetical protein M433DRAFT_171148 [Acidomyces richmondensis BFW]
MPSTLYEALDQAKKQTKLIMIRPGHETEATHCSMRTFSLFERPLPKYETMSYVWGDENLCSTVYVNNKKLNVPSSTAAVLRRMRDPRCERVVWIDSLCINQTSTDERNYQVQIMCDIYSGTTMGLI